MNVTFNTNNFNSQYQVRENRNQRSTANISFGWKSPFLNPFKKVGDQMGDFMAKHYNSKIYQSGVTEKIARFIEKYRLNSVVDRMQILGSAIISGMYMQQTLRNKNLDSEKRKTLAINQFLTFALSTALSLFADKYLDRYWEKLTRKYAVANLELEATKDMTKAERKAHKKAKLEELNKAIEEWNLSEKAKYDAKVAIGEISSDSKYVKKTIADYVSKKMANPKLTKQIEGMGVLKKLFIFGTIYRFVSPVAVTPLANWIGEKFIYSKKDKNNAA